MKFWKYFKEEAAIIRERDPAIKSDWEVLLYPSKRNSYDIIEKCPE